MKKLKPDAVQDVEMSIYYEGNINEGIIFDTDDVTRKMTLSSIFYRI
jgi:hypothetical protein